MALTVEQQRRVQQLFLGEIYKRTEAGNETFLAEFVFTLSPAQQKSQIRALVQQALVFAQTVVVNLPAAQSAETAKALAEEAELQALDTEVGSL